MRDILLILILGIYVVWGYRLMGQLDHFLDEYVKNAEDEMNDQQHHDEDEMNDQQHHDEDEMNDQQHHDGK